jgi:hypothetical protein
VSKEVFIAAHEELVEEYLNEHSEANWHMAYEATAGAANEHYRDKFADLVDGAKQRAKDAGQWPPRGAH